MKAALSLKRCTDCEYQDGADSAYLPSERYYEECNSRCYAPQNASPLHHGETHRRLGDLRTDESACGPRGQWFIKAKAKK